jgi:Ca-activated chloride channel family protein
MTTKLKLSSYCLTLTAILTLIMSSLPFAAAGQAQRAGRISQSQNPTNPKPRPTPTSAPRVTTEQPSTTKSQQPPPQEQEETLRINSNLVAVPVSVTDASGQPVRNLAVTDFLLDEEGKAQQVVSLGEPGKTPIEIALLFDVSGSVNKRFEFEQQAASRFLKQVLKPGDASSVFSIGLRPKLVQSRETNADTIITSVMAMSPTKEATAFFDSVVEAAHYLGKTSEPGTRRVLIVISDGEDNQSDGYWLTDALRELQRTDCVFYSINPSGPSIRLNKISLKGQDGMASLASVTGGAAFLPDKLEDLDAVFRQITAELQAQYLLGYYSSDERTDGGYRRINVRVAKRSDLRVRARKGYYAPKA